MNSLIAALSKVAHGWCESGSQQSRVDDAVRATLEAPNQFTYEAMAFAIDQQMSEITESALHEWIQGRRPKKPHIVGVINAGNIPFAGLQDLLAILLCGHTYLGVLSRKSPYLLPAFVDSIRSEGLNLDADFVEPDEVWERAESVIATGGDEAIAQIRSLASAKGIPSQRCLFRSNRFGVAILDGYETANDWENLALDVLLHEGMGCRNVALIFAPEGLEPDDCLHHLAKIRSLFPPHPSTPGRLTIPQAYLAAINQAHAYGDGLEFLISKGEPEAQVPGHVRWVGYKDFDEMIVLVEGLYKEIQCIVARESIHTMLPKGWSVQPLGMTQRPALDWQPDGVDTIDFLCNL
ncbi:MAG: hypothetical protein OXE92_09515 [Bacteroidetes bacterium]|nr:hypothetical protein [Bacteroidota bacterium]MCY4205946.1 hypothetical protein [Bacteroidota bacterium]